MDDSEEPVCFTLEDIVRDKKIWGKTAIPAGRYRIVMFNSPKFTPRYNTWVPMLENVPNYSYVLIHRGNTHLDTEGCILVGMKHNQESIENSKDAFNLVNAAIKKAISAGKEVWIEIKDIEAKN
jgi:hypothetical protein